VQSVAQLTCPQSLLLLQQPHVQHIQRCALHSATLQTDLTPAGDDAVLLFDDTVLQVCAGNVAWLLDMASYLEVQPLQEACCEVRPLSCSNCSCVKWQSLV
jgi:hypothetical protein